MEVLWSTSGKASVVQLFVQSLSEVDYQQALGLLFQPEFLDTLCHEPLPLPDVSNVGFSSLDA